MDGLQANVGPRVVGRQITLWAWLFTLACLVLAIPWIVWFQKRAFLPLLIGPAPARDILLGLSTGLVLALGAWEAFRRVPALGKVLYPLWEALSLRTWNLVNILLVALSAGVGEEVLFRGVLQFHLGLWWTALLFGLAHPLSRAYVAYATVAGLVLGTLAQSTGGLLASIVCHTVVDAILLYRLKRWSGGKPADVPA